MEGGTGKYRTHTSPLPNPAPHQELTGILFFLLPTSVEHLLYAKVLEMLGLQQRIYNKQTKQT